MSDFIISIDQGTSSTRAVLFNSKGKVFEIAQTEITQIYPQPGHVEHDPIEILNSTYEVLEEILEHDSLKGSKVLAMGITNQRETVVVWDKSTGKPIYNAIVWQDKRTSDICDDLRASGLAEYTKQSTGLMLDPYFSGTKVAWILDHVEGARDRAERGELCFGTIDCWLLFNFTGGSVHATDVSNASRTLLFNIKSMDWDSKMLNFLRVPKEILPDVRPSASIFGHYESGSHGSIPIAAILGDQQSALFGQCCFTPGTAKNTYGTGCFMLMNTGSEIPDTPSGLLNTVAWQIDGVTTYALEGSVFIAGAALQWLRDGLEILEDVAQSSSIAQADSEKNPYSSLVVVPAFAGLGTPYWDMHARGAIFGLTRDTDRNSIIRATLESLAFSTQDVLNAMQEDSGISLFKLQVDGGASANDYLMQFQANLLGVSVERPALLESTAAGVAFMAALSMGAVTQGELLEIKKSDRTFDPQKSVGWRKERSEVWSNAVGRTISKP
jgi:glycerol kinase